MSGEKEKFPHKELGVGLGVIALGYLLYSVATSFLSRAEQSLADEIAAKQERIRQVEDYYSHPESHGQYVQPLNLTVDINHMNNNTSAPSSPTFHGAVTADDMSNSGPCTPPAHKGGISSRNSLFSLPPSPKTHGVLEKLDSLDGENLWRRLDPDQTGKATKQDVLALISSLEDLQNFLSNVASTVNTPTLQGGDPREYKDALLQRAVDKLAGTNNQFVSYERWKKYLKGGTTFDPIHIDAIDGVD